VYQSNGVGNYPDNHWITDPQATIYIVSGAAGCTEGLSNKKSDSWQPHSEEWSWYGHRYGEDFGYGMIYVFNETHLHWEFKKSGDNRVEDDFWIVRTK